MKINSIKLVLVMFFVSTVVQSAEYQTKSNIPYYFYRITNNADKPLSIRIREDKDNGFVYYEETLDAQAFDTVNLEGEDWPAIEDDSKLRITISDTQNDYIKTKFVAKKRDVTISGQHGVYKLQTAERNN